MPPFELPAGERFRPAYDRFEGFIMCIDCKWEELLEKINDLLDSGDYEWAEDTLNGIHETVEDHEHATERQWQAITNIEEGLHKH